MIFSGIFQLRGKDMSDFNKIMAFQQMMPYLNKEQQDNLATTLGMELQEIERRLVGKNKEDEFTRITYAVEEELKYNLSIEEIKNLANSNVISLSKDNILKCLTTEGLEMIQKGDDIVILIDNIDKDRIKINICLREVCYGNTVESKRSFVKDRLMDEYYK